MSKSAYRPWRRPRITADIQPLRKIFEENPPDILVPPSPNSDQNVSGTFFPYLVRTARLASLNYMLPNIILYSSCGFFFQI